MHDLSIRTSIHLSEDAEVQFDVLSTTYDTTTITVGRYYTSAVLFTEDLAAAEALYEAARKQVEYHRKHTQAR